MLTASLASRNAETASTTSTALPHQQGCSTSENPSASSSQPADIPGANGVARSTDLVSQLPSTNHDVSCFFFFPYSILSLCSMESSSQEMHSKDRTFANMHQESRGKNGKEGSKSVSDPVDRTVEKLESVCTEVKCDLPESSHKGNSADPKPSPKRNIVDGSCSEVPLEASPRTITSSKLSSQSLEEQDKATTSSAPDEVLNSKSDDIHLSVRMPSGNRLEIKLTKQDVLREVKNFVNENLGSGVGSYDLSMIYPKRVFTEQGTELFFLLGIFLFFTTACSTACQCLV